MGLQPSPSEMIVPGQECSLVKNVHIRIGASGVTFWMPFEAAVWATLVDAFLCALGAGHGLPVES